MKLMIIDGNSIVNRAFFGVRMLNAPDGTPTNAVYGFVNILSRLINEYSPDALCVSFDLNIPTFRHRACSTYKAKRKPMPEELQVQMPILKELLTLMGINIYELEGYEADDIIGTAGSICEKNGWECIVVTGDKDSFQLISDKVSICHIKTKGSQNTTTLYTPDVFRKEYGFEPSEIVDLKALMGDSSDNIPGVAGIGEKTAIKLIQEYHTIENIYNCILDIDVKDGIKKKLESGESDARESYWLATIFKDVPVEFDPADSLWTKENFKPELFDFLLKLGFSSFIEKWHIGSMIKANSAINNDEQKAITEEDITDLSKLDFKKPVAVCSDAELSFLDIYDGKTIYHANPLSIEINYEDVLNKVFSKDIEKIGHNIKPIVRALLNRGINDDGFIFDTALSSYLFDPVSSEYPSGGIENIYANFSKHNEKLKQLGMEFLYYSAELPLCRVLADMENTGFLVDRKTLSEFGENLKENILEQQKRIWKDSGKEFNISSPKQLGEVLFEDLGLPYGKKTKTGWSTSADVLEKLLGMHPIIDEVLEYRMLTKLKSTYADGLLKVISDDGRIHTNFQMTVTATGRLSSTEPNLQNIPIRKKLGSEIRKMFIAAPGKILIDADYSQIELRLLAHISGDKAMIEAFKSGEDFHTVTASKVFNVPIEEVTPILRNRAKAVNFGIIYGISAFSLAQDIGVFTNEAKAYMDAYFAKFDGVHKYMKYIIEKAKKDGYVETIYGRRREIPELKSSNFNVRQFGERVALNMPIQGAAADIIKMAMVAAHKELSEKFPDAKLVLQVHDELIAECPEKDKDIVSDILKNSMENVAELSVPLIVDTGYGHSWAEAHK